MTDVEKGARTWPTGGGEMARLIRTHDWAVTPLGRIGGWPDTLRTAVDILLAMPRPATILWGPGHTQMYNDAYLTVADDRHPALLGRPVAEGWPEVYENTIRPLLDSVQAGRSVHLAEFAVVLRGDDRQPETRIFHTDWMPLRDSSGAIGGALQTLVDVTDSRRMEAVLAKGREEPLTDGMAEARFRESEDRFRRMAEAIDDTFYMTDLDRGAIIYVSPGYERIWGQPPAGIMANPLTFLDTLHPDDRQRFVEAQSRQARGEPVVIEYRIVRPDGNVRWIYDRSFPIARSDGSRQAAGVASDVTQRRESEERARASEALLHQFGQASADVLWIRDAETLRFEYVSPAFEAVYGVRPDAAQAATDLRVWAQMIHPDDADLAQDSIRRVREGERVTFEYRVRRPDGSERWLRDTAFPMRDDTGRVRRIGSVGQDITDLKTIEAALRDSEGRLRTLMEGIPQLVWRSADGGAWTWASPQWRAFTGQTDEESRGLGWLDAIHPDDRTTTMRGWEAAQSDAIMGVEHRVKRASDGACLWHHTRAVPVRDEAGHIVEWLGTTTDVQQLKEMQSAQTVLVAELQHRTRNLIAVVRAVSGQTMKATGPTPAFQEKFGDRLEALARVQGLLSRADEEPVTIGGLIRMELETLGAIDQDAERISLKGPPVRIRNSSVQTLALALHELATNARKYGALSPRGGRLDVVWRVRQGDDDGPHLRIEWAETGVPIDIVPERIGYGRELIERALPYALRARTEYRFEPTGVHCTIEMPLGKRERRGRIG